MSDSEPDQPSPGDGTGSPDTSAVSDDGAGREPHRDGAPRQTGGRNERAADPASRQERPRPAAVKTDVSS